MARHPRTNVPQTLCGGFALLSVLSCSASQPAGQGVSIPEASRPVDSPGCTRAHAVEQQLDTWFKEGRLDRLVTRASLAGSECPGSNLGTHPLVRRARRDLSASAAPEALLADARRAREHGDRVAARRLFSQALAAAELAEKDHVSLLDALPEVDTIDWLPNGCQKAAQGLQVGDPGLCVAVSRHRDLRLVGLDSGDTLARFELRSSPAAVLAPRSYGPALATIEEPALELLVPPHRAAVLPPAADVHAVAFHPERPLLAFVSMQRDLVLVDYKQNRTGLVELPSSDTTNPEPISARVVFSDNGATVTADVDRDVYVVDVDQRRVFRTGLRADEFVGSAMSPDGRWVAWAAEQGVQLLEVPTGRHRLLRGPGEVTSLAFDPAASRLALGTDAASGQIWLVEDLVAGNAQPLREPQPETHSPTGTAAQDLAFSPDGTYLQFSTGGGDQVLLVEDGSLANDDLGCSASTPPGQPLDNASPADSPASPASCPPSNFHQAGVWDRTGHWWASMDSSGTAVRVVDARQNVTLWTRALGCRAAEVAFSPRSDYLLAKGARCVGLFELKTGRRTPMPGVGAPFVVPRAVRMLDEGTLLVTTDNEGSCSVDLHQGEVTCTPPRWHWYEPILGPGEWFVARSTLSRKEGSGIRRLHGSVVQGSRGTLATVERRQGSEPLASTDPSKLGPRPKRWLPIELLSPDGKRRAVVQSRLPMIDHLLFDPTEHYLAAFGKGLQVWQLPSLRLAFTQQVESVKAAAFDPEGKRLIVATAGRLSWQNTRLGRVVAEQPLEGVRALAVGRGDIVAAAVPFPLRARSPERALVELFDFGSGVPRKIRSELLGCLPDAQGLTFSPDGTKLVVACPEAIIWLDVASAGMRAQMRLLPNGALVEDSGGPRELFGHADRWLACKIGDRVFGGDLCEDRYRSVGLLTP